MDIFYTKAELKAYLYKEKKTDKQIGFVPTMGALHKGHLSLLKESQKENDISVVSVFINPTQFDKKEDLIKYPKTLDKDLAFLRAENCDIVFIPSVKEIYENNITSRSFEFDGLEHEMEGKFRDGHFNGVATVISLFFEIIEPNNAYFGQKDFQQLQIVRKLVEKYRLSTKIKGCPIFREDDGLAMSSRNNRLSIGQRKVASTIFKTLKEVKKKYDSEDEKSILKWVENEFEKQPLLKLEYFMIADEMTLKTITEKDKKTKYRALIAVFAGNIRLIDNIQL